jgi:hypothetical protein
MKLALLLICFSTVASAQTEPEIRKYYQETNARIEESMEQGFEGPLYHNRWIVNGTGKSWPAVGRYADTADFWYDQPPDHLPATERDPKKVLLKVVVNRVSSHYHRHEEYLFKNGLLIFYFANEAEEGHGWETRAWFNAKGVIRTNVRVNELEITAKDLEYKDVAPDLTEIRKNAKDYQDLFVKSML